MTAPPGREIPFPLECFIPFPPSPSPPCPRVGHLSPPAGPRTARPEPLLQIVSYIAISIHLKENHGCPAGASRGCPCRRHHNGTHNGTFAPLAPIRRDGFLFMTALLPFPRLRVPSVPPHPTLHLFALSPTLRRLPFSSSFPLTLCPLVATSFIHFLESFREAVHLPFTPPNFPTLSLTGIITRNFSQHSFVYSFDPRLRYRT